MLNIMKKLFGVCSLKHILFFLIPAIFVMFMVHGLNNDSWFVLAEGRYLVENGIHYTDVLTIHEGMNIVVQNYGFAAIFYLIYSVLGASGLYVMMLLLNFIVCYLIYKICILISNKNVNLSLLIMAVTDCLLIKGEFITTRAQMVDYVIILALIYVLELFIKTDKTKFLWWLPVLSFMQINLHASMWWILILIIGAYIIDGIRKPKLHLQGYRVKPLIIMGIVVLFVGLINPYGVKMITYIFTSYGVPEINNMVDEMASFDMRSTFNILIYMVLVVVLMLYIFGEKKRIRMRYLLMFFGFLALGLNSMRGMSQFILVMFFPLALLYKNVKVGGVIDAELARRAVVFWAGMVTISIFVVQCAILVPQIKNGPDDDVIGAVDAIESSAGDDKNMKVYVGYNNGGYVEFRGYKAYLDPRAEVFLKNNNGKEDILKEWEEMIKGELDSDEFLKKYNFDYLIVEELYEKELYNMKDEKYEVIYEYGDDGGGIKVLKCKERE